jgi:hypothetical protein
MIHTKIEHHKLLELAKDAPALHCKHLLDLQQAADNRGDSIQSAIILKILTQEQERNKRSRINYTTQTPQGGNPLTGCFQVGAVVNQYDTKQEVVDHTLDHLSKCSRVVYSVPNYQGQLFDDLGFMGDTECSKQILEGTHEYPPNTNVWTNKILQEAHYPFSRMSGAKIATTISTVDFKQYWIKVDKWTSSSFSGVTFLHYRAAASHSMLLVMHAVYLSACA